MPRELNGFQIIRKIADSNTAEIFQALRLTGKGRGREYALKVLRKPFARSRLERSYLETEQRVCSDLDHPCLVGVHGLALDAERPYLVMDYVDGPALRQVLTKGLPKCSDALGWLAQVADGLAYLHGRGYVHRDVKPQNIVIGNDGQPCLIDFALAMRQDATRRRHWLRRLVDRKRPGTWSYMSPEQIRNLPLAGQTDVYSLGVTLYETLTRRLPYAAETQQELLAQHLSAPIPSARSARPGLPIELDELVRGMMAKEPLDRPSGMGYVCARLRQFAEDCADLG